MCDKRFYLCKHCGNLVGLIQDGGGTLICCGEPMVELTANSTDASREKHVPVVSVEGDTVRVSIAAAAHPMAEEHFIPWIYLQTARGGQRKCLKAGEKPEAVFTLNGDTPVAAFAYCNLHGLWETEL